MKSNVILFLLCLIFISSNAFSSDQFEREKEEIVLVFKIAIGKKTGFTEDTKNLLFDERFQKLNEITESFHEDVLIPKTKDQPNEDLPNK